jgi:FixJ family two-component response regulator
MNLRKENMARSLSAAGRTAGEASPAASRHSVHRMEARSERGANGYRLDSTTVALVGLNAQDQASLKMILRGFQSPHAPAFTWHVQPEPSVQSVMAAIDREPIAIVICDRDWVEDDWKSLLDRFAGLDRPPMLIVTSRLADDRLWAEALNLGAYDVIAKPFDASEVVRIAGLACAHWNQCEGGRAAVMHSVA